MRQFRRIKNAADKTMRIAGYNAQTRGAMATSLAAWAVLYCVETELVGEAIAGQLGLMDAAQAEGVTRRIVDRFDSAPDSFDITEVKRLLERQA